MTKQRKTIVSHTFAGGRFEDHGIDLDVLPDLLRYKDLLGEVAKELWRRRNPERKNLPPNFDKALSLRFYEVRCNCATIPLEREIEVDEQSQFDFNQESDLDDAVSLVASTIHSAHRNEPLPARFPKHLLAAFREYGKTLHDDEWIEHRSADNHQLCRYDNIVRSRLSSWSESSYEDYADVTGEVTMARVSKPRMSIELADGREIEAAFRPEDEEVITTALQKHRIARLHVVGRGVFSVDGLLQRVTEVTHVKLLLTGELLVEPSAKPIWEEFAQILKDVPEKELAKLPSDGAHNHDFYIYGATRESP